MRLAHREVDYRERRLDTLDAPRRQRASTRAEIDSARAQLPQAKATLLRARLEWTEHLAGQGGRIGAEVIEVQSQAAKLPADRVGPLSPRSQAIVVRLKPDTPLPEKYLNHQLPLNVRLTWRMPWAQRVRLR